MSQEHSKLIRKEENGVHIYLAFREKGRCYYGNSNLQAQAK